MNLKNGWIRPVIVIIFIAIRPPTQSFSERWRQGETLEEMLKNSHTQGVRWHFVEKWRTVVDEKLRYQKITLINGTWRNYTFPLCAIYANEPLLHIMKQIIYDGAKERKKGGCWCSFHIVSVTHSSFFDIKSLTKLIAAFKLMTFVNKGIHFPSYLW